jgi:hypothetical protein
MRFEVLARHNYGTLDIILCDCVAGGQLWGIHAR